MSKNYAIEVKKKEEEERERLLLSALINNK